MPKSERGTLWDFPTSILSQNMKKLKKTKFSFSGKNLTMPKKTERGEKQEKPFWFSSLDQIVQFGAIIFCITFKNYFGQFVWIEKKESL